MIEFHCPDCQQLLRAGDHQAGKMVGCVHCTRPVEVPDARLKSGSSPVIPPAPPVVVGDPFAFQSGLPSFVGDPVVEERGKYANCPHCRCPGHADRVTYTWWGGFVGPLLITLVRCRKCRATYNGSSGQRTDTAVAMYVGVSIALGIFLALCATLARRH